MLKHKMVLMGIKVGMYKRILSVMIEALENVYKNSGSFYHDPNIPKAFLPEFQLKKVENSYYIFVSNPIRSADIELLKNRLDFINNHSNEDLRTLYRQTISDGKFSDKGGAGLGIIEIAKISGNSMQYSFTPINSNYFYYTLIITFN